MSTMASLDPSAMAALSAGVTAITASKPPTTDYLTYLTILESHLSKELLPTLNIVLQDAVLTQNIGWDLIELLLPFGEDAEGCFVTIARLGNPREVILKVVEALSSLDMESLGSESENGELESQLGGVADANVKVADDGKQDIEDIAGKLEGSKLGEEKDSVKEGKAEKMAVTEAEKFCLLLKVLSIVHPRIKTKYPSRFLSTSLIAILKAYRGFHEANCQGLHEANLAILLFMHSVSGEKRPALPIRKSSIVVPSPLLNPEGNSAEQSAPDPEGEAEDPKEAAIQKKLLQAFLTHVLEEYIGSNWMAWAARIYEVYQPGKIVPAGVRQSIGARYKEDPIFQQRDSTVGQLVALARDLGLTSIPDLLHATYAIEKPADHSDPDASPESPEDIPLSQLGSLYLLTCFVFSSEYFGNAVPVTPLSIFPDHQNLVHCLLGGRAVNLGHAEPATVDALIFLGIWMEHHNKFVAGPLPLADFFHHLQALEMMAITSPSPEIRYHAQLLSSSILHAHPEDSARLSHILDTLEHCPEQRIRALAVGWLKEEMIVAYQRKLNNVFSKEDALHAVKEHLFPDLMDLSKGPMNDILADYHRSFTFYIALVNFLIFLCGEAFVPMCPSGMKQAVDRYFTLPLSLIRQRLYEAISPEGQLAAETHSEASVIKFDLALLEERLDTLLSGKLGTNPVGRMSVA